MVDGKRRLIEATARLARQQPIGLPGLRALAREAALNHNTFYRHFQTMDDLLDAAAQTFTAGLLAERRDSQPSTTPPDAVLGTIFDTAASQPDMFTLAYRILHGGPSRARDTMRALTTTLATALAAELALLGLLPPEPDIPRLLRTLEAHITHTLALARHLTEDPSARDALVAQAGDHLLVALSGVGKKRLLA